jgi:excisionase family DNA binding protein
MNEKELYTPAQAAKKLGVSVKTIQRWDKAGKIAVVRTLGNQRRISAQEVRKLLGLRPRKKIRCAVYARVSSQKQAKDGNLERQKQRLVEAAQERGYEISDIITEQASGLNEKRRGLKKLFKEAARDEMEIVLIEFKDRLARFGFAYLEKTFALLGVKIEVLDKTPAPGEELVQDMISIITVFSARLYGSRAKIFKAKVNHAMKECAK